MSEIIRKLVTIQRVTALEPIEGADRIEVASVLGWKIVVQKGLYVVNDFVAFFEIDSYLPIRPEYEFLRKSSFRITKELGEGFRLKTCKLRGQISQGLLMPLSELGITVLHSEFEEGMDLTEQLGVRLWEPGGQTMLSGNAEGSFPHYIIKTDEPRIQNLARERQNWADDEFAVTVKYDGSSMTVFCNGELKDDTENKYKVGVCSRNWSLKDEEGNTYWKVAHESGLVEILSELGLRIAIQGELVGPGVQGNPYKYDKLHFIIFNIFDIGNQRYLTSPERKFFIDSVNNRYNLNLINCYSLPYFVKGIPDQETLDKVLVNIGKINGQDIEGVVFKSLQHPERSYKYISPTYLLKDKE